MMFSAGMGIGLMFFGVAEPLSHMGAPPFGLADPNTKGAAQVAMQYTYFHWAFHPWAIYAIMGLALAYFTFRKGMPNLISTAFYPLLGDRVYGPIGKTIDILAIFATLFGSATSLGLGALQINQGLNAVFGIGGREAVGLAIVVIAVLTLAFVLSAISGVHRGIQWIANTNMVLAVFLLVFVFLLGPTVFILNTFTESLGAYLSNIIPMSFRTASYGDSDFRLRLDHLLLGVVDKLGAVCWRVYRPHLPRPHHPGVRRRRRPGPELGQLRVVRHPRRLRHRPAARRDGEHRRDRREQPAGGPLLHPRAVPLVRAYGPDHDNPGGAVLC
jgi:hypothetical protein